MEAVGQYILSVILAALICGILSSVVSGTGKAWVQMLCGFAMLICLIRPFSGIQDLEFSLIDDAIQEEGTQWSNQGEKMARNAMADIITQNSQAYIMDKAEQLDIHVRVKILVSNDIIPVPVGAELYGEVSPYARLRVESLIENELGIAKENIRWIQ